MPYSSFNNLASPALTGTPTAPTATAGTNTTQIATTAFVQANSRPYKVYTALISQSGTNAPVATVLENTLGGTVVWTRIGTGQYEATLSSAFTVDKTVPIYINGSFVVKRIDILRTGSSTVLINTFTEPTHGNYTLSDSLLGGGASVEFRVYN